MNLKVWIPLALALAMGIVAAKVGRDTITKNRTSGPAPQKMVEVAVAARDLEPGQVLQASDLKIQRLPIQVAPKNGFHSAADAEGRVVATPIFVEQVVTDTLLLVKGAPAGAQALVPEGMRAVTLEVNEFSGLAGLLAPGCRVDVLATLRDDAANQTVSRTLVENVKIMAVGQRLSLPKEATKDDPNNTATRSVTLIVKPRDAEALELASSAGRTRLVLRSTADTHAMPSKGMTVADLVGARQSAPPTVWPALLSLPQPTTMPVAVRTAPTTQAAPASAAAPAAQRRVIQLIRGAQESSVEMLIVPPAAPKADGPTEDGALTGVSEE
jgi:pilus assembly protein CpaB